MSDIHPVIAIHGGAGAIRRSFLSPEKEEAYHVGLRAALEAGLSLLRAGASALDAVTASVMALEDDPLFNAGCGAVFTSDRTQEMDAAIMSGVDRACGAVAGICGPRHPVLAARAVLEKSGHVLLVGEGAERFCREAGLEHMPSGWFETEARLVALQTEMERRHQGYPDDNDPARKHGTVGAVALDREGHLAAATSTGGMTGKMPGRVGDSPVIGAGTWASDETCAVSATGYGEFFIRWGVAHEVDARMRWGKQSLEQAAMGIIHEIAPVGGSGGVIAVDTRGNIALPFNCEGMYRAWCGVDGKVHTAIYKEYR